MFLGLMLGVSSTASLASAGHASVQLDKAQVSVLDTASLQRGADVYAKYCMGCHSMKYLRINRAARDLGWSDEQGVSNFQYLRGGKGKPHDPILTTIDATNAKLAFGVLPPDLSLETRLRGKDWVYTFLRSYERDSQGKVTNRLFDGVAMPYILEGLQKELSPAAFDATVGDLVNFMDYAAEPAKVVRLTMGWWVLGFIALLFMLTLLLKKEFWRDIKSS